LINYDGQIFSFYKSTILEKRNSSLPRGLKSFLAAKLRKVAKNFWCLPWGMRLKLYNFEGLTVIRN